MKRNPGNRPPSYRGKRRKTPGRRFHAFWDGKVRQDRHGERFVDVDHLRAVREYETFSPAARRRAKWRGIDDQRGRVVEGFRDKLRKDTHIGLTRRLFRKRL